MSFYNYYIKPLDVEPWRPLKVWHLHHHAPRGRSRSSCRYLQPTAPANVQPLVTHCKAFVIGMSIFLSCFLSLHSRHLIIVERVTLLFALE